MADCENEKCIECPVKGFCKGAGSGNDNLASAIGLVGNQNDILTKASESRKMLGESSKNTVIMTLKMTPIFAPVLDQLFDVPVLGNTIMQEVGTILDQAILLGYMKGAQDTKSAIDIKRLEELMNKPVESPTKSTRTRKRKD
jgi:hypothetical protein